MIGVVDVHIQAANPNMPLMPMRAYLGSPSSIRVRNVPKKIGDWQITSVQLVAAYPDNTIKTADCKLLGSVWVGTIVGSAMSGTSKSGYTIFASGTDENGNPIYNYALGKGDIEILETDGAIAPHQPFNYVHLRDEEPEQPMEGDLYPDENGNFKIWQDGEAHSLGGISEQEVIDIVTATETAYTPWACVPDVEKMYDYAKVVITYMPASQHWLYEAKDTTNNDYVFMSGTSIETGEDALSLTFETTEPSIPTIEASRQSFTVNALGLATYEELQDGLEGKQDALTTSQMDAVDSGITSSKVGVYDGYQSTISGMSDVVVGLDSSIDAINRVIPQQTWLSGNELADKAFVNSSVQTATANFRGNWATWATVPSTSSEYPEDYAGSRTPTVNDYLVVQDAVGYGSGYDGTWRFKYSGTWADDGKSGWLPEYQVNETPLTASQLAAIDSGITSALVSKFQDTATKIYNDTDNQYINGGAEVFRLSSYTDPSTSEVGQSWVKVDSLAMSSAIPSTMSQLVDDVGYVTASQIVPATNDSLQGFWGYGKQAIYAAQLLNIKSGQVPNKLHGLILSDGVPYVTTENYAPWTLTKWAGSTLSEAATLNFGYYGNVTIKVGGRNRTVGIHSYAWVANMSSFLYIIKAEEDADGIYQPTGMTKSTGSISYSDITLSSNGLSIETIGGQSDQVECTRTSANPTHTQQVLAFASEVPTVPSNVGAFTNDVGYVTASAIPSNVGAFNNDVGYTTASSVVSIVTASTAIGVGDDWHNYTSSPYKPSWDSTGGYWTWQGLSETTGAGQDAHTLRFQATYSDIPERPSLYVNSYSGGAIEITMPDGTQQEFSSVNDIVYDGGTYEPSGDPSGWSQGWHDFTVLGTVSYVCFRDYEMINDLGLATMPYVDVRMSAAMSYVDAQIGAVLSEAF